MNSEVRLLSLSVTFDSDRILEFVFLILSLRVKMLGFQKKGEFKEEEEEENRVNKLVLAITVEYNI